MITGSELATKDILFNTPPRSIEDVEGLAIDILGIPTLKRKNSDELDFHSIPVWDIRAIIRLAFNAGLYSVQLSDTPLAADTIEAEVAELFDTATLHPAKSQSQRELFCMALDIKEGRRDPKSSVKAAGIAKRLSTRKLKEFCVTQIRDKELDEVVRALDKVEVISA